jgi:hypothetical protein
MTLLVNISHTPALLKTAGFQRQAIVTERWLPANRCTARRMDILSDQTLPITGTEVPGLLAAVERELGVGLADIEDVGDEEDPNMG